MTAYPGAIKSFTDQTDLVSTIDAADVNEAYDEIEAIETELGTDVAGSTTSLKVRLAHSLNDAGYLNFDAATELTISSGAVTVTQNVHKLQPQSGTSDDLDTISGTAAGDFGVLYVSDFGTDTITVKHNTGNVLCVGNADVALSNGGVSWFSNGTKVFVLGGGGGAAASGWNTATGAWTYTSADDPTFVASVNADVTAELSVGMRIKLTQTTAKYFIVTAIGAYTGGATAITLYGGTDYDLADAAISAVYYSTAKAPFGFPLSPAVWTVEYSDTTQRSQASPVASTWYNINSTSITIPIGLWDVSYEGSFGADRASGGDVNIFTTLSTANNSESDVDLTSFCGINTAVTFFGVGGKKAEKVLLLTTKTAYYLNAKTDKTLSTLYYQNDIQKLFIRARCAYL